MNLANKKHSKTTYIGARLSREDYWILKQALTKNKEKMQDGIIRALCQYYNIKISSPNNIK